MIFTDLENNWWRGDYLRFKDAGRVSPGAKTSRWTVWSRHDSSLLGEIRWWIRWRQYVFIPQPEKLFDMKCMREAADFCEYVTAVHKESLTQRG